MKTTRRQELRTNELSEQLDLLAAYLKRNATALTIAAVAVIVVGAAGYWYYNRQTTRSNEAWAQLSPDPDMGTMAMLDQYKAVAGRNISPALTRAAWLEAGHLALTRLGLGEFNAGDASSTTAPADGADPDVLAEVAEEAFTNVVKTAGDDFTALGRALVGLGVLAEDRWDTAKAREWYLKVLDEKRLDGTPFQTEARFRLEHIDNWSSKIVFSDAPPATNAASPSSEAKLTPIDPSELPASLKNLPAALSPTPAPAQSGTGTAAQSRPAASPMGLEPVDPASLRSDDTQLPSEPESEKPAGPQPAAATPTTQPADDDSGSSD